MCGSGRVVLYVVLSRMQCKVYLLIFLKNTEKNPIETDTDQNL